LKPKKADTFMKFNNAEIVEETGFAPTRAYFCIACAGYHVTSKQPFLNYVSMTERVMQTYEHEKAFNKEQKKVSMAERILA
jgi:hypothetical protein